MNVKHLDTLVGQNTPRPEDLFNNIMKCIDGLSPDNLSHGCYYFNKNWLRLNIEDHTISTYKFRIKHYIESSNTIYSYMFYYDGSKHDKNQLLNYCNRVFHRAMNLNTYEPWEVN